MTLPDYAIEARGLVKTYPATRTTAAKTALDHIDLAVPRGSIFGLLGPNGAGKSTFINILAGLTQKTAGSVSIWGRDIDSRPRDARAAIGVVPQELAADVFFTPRESLEVQAGLYGVPKAERQTDALLAALGLSDKADAYVRALSGGMKRRLMVAKAMVHRPPVLILDEPTAGVDVELRRQLWSYVKGLNDLGVTIVLTTHYLEEAEKLCDRIAIINHGELIANKPTRELVGMAREKIIVLTLDREVEEMPSHPGFVKCVKSGERSLEITYDKDRSNAGEIMSALQAQGFAIIDVTTREADLEDVFVTLTSEARAA